MLDWLFGASLTERAQAWEIESLRKQRADLSDRLQLVGATLEEMLEERKRTVDLLIAGSMEELIAERKRLIKGRADACEANRLRKATSDRDEPTPEPC